MSKILHILTYIGIGIALLLVAVTLFAFIFLRAWKPFGGRASEEDRKDYSRRALNFDGKKFHNEEDFSVLSMQKNPAPDPMKISGRATRPNFDFPTKKPDFSPVSMEELRVTWFGHSSLLIQMHGMKILVDPVFSEMISPVSFVGSRRYSNPGLSAGELPETDILLLSHDHYDHLDYDLIRKIDKKVRRYIVPLGVEKHLERWGVQKQKITNMTWWEEADEKGLSITCTPAKHFSGRGLKDRMNTLWCSWVLKDGHHKIFESGDSGFGGHFQKIHEKFGDFDLAIMECGQYDMQWPKVHMFPEQSVEAAKILGAKVAMPIHWGAIVLSRHGWDDPVERFLRAAEKEGLRVITPFISQRANPEEPELYEDRWWRQAGTSVSKKDSQ